MILRRLASTTATTGRLPTLTLYTGRDCQLCDVAKRVLDELQRDSLTPPFVLKLYDIRDDSLEGVQRWRRAYQYDIPVLHLDGKEIARHRVDAKGVQHALHSASRR